MGVGVTVFLALHLSLSEMEHSVHHPHDMQFRTGAIILVLNH